MGWRPCSVAMVRVGHVAHAERDVLAPDRVRLKLRLQLLARRARAGDDHDAARPLVEPVHDPRPHVPRRVALVPQERLGVEETEREEPVHERPALVATRRVHDDARGLVYDDDGRIDVQHVERDAVARAPRS